MKFLWALRLSEFMNNILDFHDLLSGKVYNGIKSADLVYSNIICLLMLADIYNVMFLPQLMALRCQK